MKTLLCQPLFQISPTKFPIHENYKTNSQNKIQRVGLNEKTSNSSLFSSLPFSLVIQKSLPLIASVALLLSASPVMKAILSRNLLTGKPTNSLKWDAILQTEAGLMSGFSGIESIPGPQLPQIDFLNRINEENQKKYAEADERFKSSPILKQLLERSKLNKIKNQQEIQDKYCVRGAEWGVGDCSTEGMSPQDRDDFIAMLKQKAGMK